MLEIIIAILLGINLAISIYDWIRLERLSEEVYGFIFDALAKNSGVIVDHAKYIDTLQKTLLKLLGAEDLDNDGMDNQV